MTRFRLTLRCNACGHKYKRTIECAGDVADVPDPPCPRCAKPRRKPRHKGLKGIIESQSAPAVTGGNIRNKAIDETANIVMDMYGMSDLKTNTREGDTMAPSLTPRQKMMSEHFWGGKRGRRNLVDMKPTVQAAMQGAFLPGRGARAGDGAISGNEVLTSLHSNRVRPKVNIIADATRESLRK